MWLRGCTPLGWFGVRLRSPFVSSCGFSSCGYSSYPFLGGTLTRLQGVPLPAPRGYPLPVPGGGTIVRPNCTNFPAKVLWLYGRFRGVYGRFVGNGFPLLLSQLSGFSRSTFRFCFPTFRFCGSFCLVLMPPLSGFENRPFFSRLVRPARCSSSCSLALRGEGSGNTERK